MRGTALPENWGGKRKPTEYTKKKKKRKNKTKQTEGRTESNVRARQAQVSQPLKLSAQQFQ